MSVLSLLAFEAIDLGFIELTEEQLTPLIAGAGRILIVLAASFVIVRVAGRTIDSFVAKVRDRDNGLVDRVRGRARGKPVDPIAIDRRVRRAEALASVGRSVVAAVVWTLALFSALSTIGVELGPYIAGLGIVGVALGFGAQDLVKDFISGMFMLVEDQYGVGDQVDAGDAVGTVEGVSLRTTRIRSVDGTLWFVPNGEIRRLGNMSQDWARALLDIGVAYDTDTDHASAVIEEVARGMTTEPEFAAMFLADPEVWGVQRLGADAVDIRLVIKTTPGDQWVITRELNRRLKQAFDAQGIEIPFPQRTIWVRRETEGVDTTAPAGDSFDA